MDAATNEGMPAASHQKQEKINDGFFLRASGERRFLLNPWLAYLLCILAPRTVRK
jgi:hypothetical protein